MSVFVGRKNMIKKPLILFSVYNNYAKKTILIKAPDRNAAITKAKIKLEKELKVGLFRTDMWIVKQVYRKRRPHDARGFI